MKLKPSIKFIKKAKSSLHILREVLFIALLIVAVEMLDANFMKINSSLVLYAFVLGVG